MKKYLLTAIALIFLLTGVVIPIELYAADKLTFSIGSPGNITSGETVVVPITVSNNPGFTTVGLVVTYDPNVLEIAAVTAPVAEMPLNSQFAITATPGTQWISLVNTNLTDWNGNGTVVYITFTVKPTAISGTSNISLGFTNSPNGAPANTNGDILANVEALSKSVNVVAGGTGNNSGSNGGGSSSSGSNNRGTTTPTSTTLPTATPTPASLQSTAIPQEPADNDFDNSADSSSHQQYTDNDSSDTENDDEHKAIDDGSFIGNPYIADETGSVSDNSEANQTNTDNSATVFGKVPQTGVSDIMGMVFAMCACFLISIALCVYILQRIRRRCTNG